jgi:ATP-dependent DNA ligase
MHMTNFPTLYHLNKDGSIQEWTISVSGRTITKTYGRKDGALHSVQDVIRSGKNKGRANETTAEQQAEAEAEAAWKRKQKSGYHQSLSCAKRGKVDAKFVKGGIEPMLAKKWEDCSDKVEYPVFVQPKLDGIRCIAVVENGKCTLWTRKRKPILSVPHIVEQIERWARNFNPASAQLQPAPAVFDGELYNHSYKNDFEKIVSAVRKNKPSDLSAEIEYHIYDCIDSSPQCVRIGAMVPTLHGHSVIRTASYLCKNEKEVMQRYNQFLREGYEGAMVRAANGLYENRRSSNLLKMKDFDDAEFKIVGMEEGRGAFKGCAIFQCEAKELDKPFSCKMRGSVDLLKSIFKDKSKVIGKKITVRYQGVTNGGVPRFPVGIAIRDYE